MVKIIITGVCGKMGSTILNLALKDADLAVAGGIETKNHPLIGKRIDAIAGTIHNAPTIGDDLSKTIHKCDVVVDFTEPKSSLEHFRVARSHKKAIVMGTTGFSDKALKEIKGSKDARVVISPNMSIGMNLMFDVVERLSKALQEGYDIEIVEMHHRLKKDAPSGTALILKDIVQMSKPDKNWIEVFGRKGITGERKKEEIGVLALRGGDVVGEHTVLFAGIGERLEVTHRAYSRENFARGALLAAKWITHQKNGVYSMKDVLGI
ncbi:MAG: 4-hydroxy-tetrahydrodipicolinate reductase [Proteobacteria bacterium]|jgi:4-hydroxy-tetrahydrodipicolinate reductase|nr:4-hydroxy-tetrahydrodipicolinate reductase [Pseudomonadota bacterium]